MATKEEMEGARKQVEHLKGYTRRADAYNYVESYSGGNAAAQKGPWNPETEITKGLRFSVPA